MVNIWKEVLPRGPGGATLLLQSPGTILSVGLDPSGSPCIWYGADPEREEKVEVTVRVVWTGHTFNPALERFIGTFIKQGLVYHLFQVIATEKKKKNGPNVKLIDERPQS